MQYTMKLREEPFRSMQKGEKCVELRLYDEKRKGIRAGDGIRFTNLQTGEELFVSVTDVAIFPDFTALYQAYDKRALGYKEGEQAKPEDMYAYYSVEEIAKYGVVAISVRIAD